MDKAIEKYKKRRQERLDAKNGVQRTEYDSVSEYRRRRDERLNSRMDAGVGWVFGVLKDNGVDTRGMSVKEAFEALKKLGGGGKRAAEKEKGKEKAKGVEEKSAGKSSKTAEIKKSKPENDRKKKECDGSEYKGDPGEVKSGKNGNMKPKSEISKRIDTKDAVAETERWKQTGGKEGIERNSLSGHVDENGNLSPERQKMHDEIVQKFFADKVPYDGKATMIMSGGGPASGKSFVSKGAENEFGKDTVIVVDPDDLKSRLAGYADMAVDGDKAAGFYHEESSALAKRIYQYAVDNNLNVVYDGTGDGSVNSVKKKLKTAQDAGYAVRGDYVTVNVDGENGALERNKGRYNHALEQWNAGEAVDPPRLVGDKHVRKIHAAVSDIAPDVANLFDEWRLTDNNVPQGAKRPLIATCTKGGKIRVVKGMEQKVQDWLDKGTRGGKVQNGTIVFPDQEEKRTK